MTNGWTEGQMDGWMDANYKTHAQHLGGKILIYRKYENHTSSWPSVMKF